MSIFLIIVLVFASCIAIFVRTSSFGRAPEGERLEKIKKSPNYKDGAFQNLSNTPALTEGVSYWAVLKEFFFVKKERTKPIESIPSVKTSLLNLNINEDVLVWFGHSSYFMQVDGKKILVDPVLSGAASPISFTTRSFDGTDAYTVNDIPEIDYLLISHDHWDHCDYKTLLELKNKVSKIICGLGVGSHLERWGFDMNLVVEKDWNEEIKLDSGFIVYTAPARHFSGRGFKRNQTLWTSFVLKTPSHKIYLGGDSGYDIHFTEIGKMHGPFDLVILENGQYDKSWKYIHMMPNEVLQAAKDLNAKRLFPVHSSKFALANHSWDDPLKQIVSFNREFNVPVLTPMIGEQVNLKDYNQIFTEWWTKVN